MKIDFNVKPYDSTMTVTVQYKKDDVNCNYFYLNRDFVVGNCYVDGTSYDIARNMELVRLDDFGYDVNKYKLPDFKSLTLEYTGFLSGKTGCCPYVREVISPEFTLIRWETFCYPIFYDENISLFEFLTKENEIDISLEIPEKLIAVGDIFQKNEPVNGESINNKTKKYFFKSQQNEFAIAISSFEIKQLSFGKFYLLGEIDTKTLENTIAKAHDFMNKNFGERDISSKINYVSIPDKFGSFARETAIFIEKGTFESVKKMNGIVHEFIHLGWNAQADNTAQKIRFFDEAFTSYFEMRVMDFLMGENYKLAELTDRYKKHLEYYDPNIPIIDFGSHGYGDLSYTIGAILLHELCKFVGVEIFQQATTTFLHKYKDTPVNIEVFCEEYIKLCKKPELNEFFHDWIYTTNFAIK